MHATIEQLLAIRDRELQSAKLKQHVEICLLCRERMDAMILARDELRRLPAQEPSSDLWPAILARAARVNRTVRQRQNLARYGGFGLAASAILACVLVIYQSPDTNERPDMATTPAQVIGAVEPPDNPLPTPAATEPELAELITRSARLEAVLHALPQRPRITRASTADLIAGLQENVALLDYQLNVNTAELPAQASRQLWQQRVDLMNSLVNVRYAEAQQVAYTPN